MSSFFPSPGYRRWFVVVLALAVFTAWDGWWELWIAAQSLYGDAPKSVELSVPLGLSVDLNATQSGAAMWLLIKVFASLGFSFFIERLVNRAIYSEIAAAGRESEEIENRAKAQQLLELLVQKAGISFTSSHGLSGRRAVDQRYATIIRESVEKSRDIRAMSIAAYQSIGMRNKSMLFDLLRANKFSNLKVILVDPKKGRGIVEERSRLLGGAVHPDEICDQIEKTTTALQELKDQRESHEGLIELRLIAQAPAFRLLITDDTAFVSAYQPGKEGHETPVIVVKKIDADEGPQESFYDAFLQLFENAWAVSESTEKRSPSKRRS